MLRRGAQDAIVPGQISLGQRRHHATEAGPADLQLHLGADREHLFVPLLLGKIPLFRLRRDDYVWAEAPGLEAARGIQRPERIERGIGNQVDDAHIEERLRRHRLVRHFVPPSQALDVRPIFLQRSCGGRSPQEAHRLFESRCQARFDIGIFRGNGGAVRQRDADRGQRAGAAERPCESRLKIKEVRPFRRVLGAGNLAVLGVRERVNAVAFNSARPDAGCVQFLSHHRFDGVTVQCGDGANFRGLIA